LEFQPVELVSIDSSAAAEFHILSDGSYLASGKNPEVDRVTITAKSNLGEITGFRIEALPHESLGGRGPGRTDHGNFVVSEIRVEAAPQNQFDMESRIALATAAADFTQDGFSPAAAIDGKDATGWAIAPQTGREHWIAVTTKSPIDT